MTAINKSPNVFSASVQHMWHPSVDGNVITRHPYESIRKGLHAKVCPQLFYLLLSFHFACLLWKYEAEGMFWQVPLVSGVCEDEGTYVNWNKLYTLIFILSGSMFSFANIRYVFLLWALLELTKLDSNNAEFLAYIKSKYVTWFRFTTQSRRLNPTAAISVDYLQQSNWLKLNWRIPTT